MEDAATLATDREVPVGERDEELALAARSDPAAFGILYGEERLPGPWVLKFSAP